MSNHWSFGDEFDDALELTPGPAMCHNCGAPAPEGVPASLQRCKVCKRLLHTCYNCALYNGIGCLIRSPYMHCEGAEIGQFCPSFVWRKVESDQPDDTPDTEPTGGKGPAKRGED